MAIRLFHQNELPYIKHELECGDTRRQKNILQHISFRISAGYLFRSQDLVSIQILVSGLVLTSTSDKVVQWSLNVLGQVGQKEYAVPSALHAIEHKASHPEIVASALAVLARTDPDGFDAMITSGKYPRELMVLSALRNVPVGAVDTRDVSIDIESADAETLKLALLTVGLDRAPNHIFHPRFSNRQIVKALGGHHSPIVSQYSVWAISSNRKLNIDDLGINLKEIDSKPANVRKWAYRLCGDAAGNFLGRHDLVVQGSQDMDSEVRLGLATGLRDTFYDGLEETTTRWYVDESDELVRSGVLDHIVKQSDNCPSYVALGTDVYSSEPNNLELRQRMEASAAGRKIYGDFRRIALMEQGGGLLNLTVSGDAILKSPKIKIGSISGAAIAVGGGNAINYGDVRQLISSEDIPRLMKELAEVGSLVDRLPIEKAQKDATLSAIEDAKSEPTVHKVGAVSAALKVVESSLSSLANAGDYVVRIGGTIALLASMIPH